MLCSLIPNIYKMLRLRDFFIKNLGKGIFFRVGHMHVLKKFFLFKLFAYRANEYYTFLCKKLKQ